MEGHKTKPPSGLSITPMHADHLDALADLESLAFSTPWSYDALAEELAGQKQAAAAERKLILETKYGSKTYSLDELLHLYLAEGEHKTDILEHLKEEAL